MKIIAQIKSLFREYSVMVYATIFIVVLEIIAFLRFPNRNLSSLLLDIVAMIVGFLVGFCINTVTKWISYEYKLNIVFGFLFLGIGWVATPLWRDYTKLLSGREFYAGSIIIILSVVILALIKKPTIIKDDVRAKKRDNITGGDRLENGFKKPAITASPTVFFHDRMCDAFPGITGVEWITKPRIAVERLSILLREPTYFDKSDGYGTRHDPIWWFRGGRHLYIKTFEKLKGNRCLMNCDELNIDKIAIVRPPAYWSDCVYVECRPDKQCGLYKYTKDKITQGISRFGYCWEEYGLYGNRLITRSEYDDNAIIENGKTVKTDGAELRVRFLSTYNFIITSAFSPYNTNGFISKSEHHFNGLLLGKVKYNEFFKWLLSLPRNDLDD